MTHPHDLLANLVDGTLDPEQRAVVDAHLGTCTTCRDEVALAAAGRASLRALPTPRTPAAVGTSALEEAASSRVGSRRAPGAAGAAHPAAAPDHPRWYRWAGAAAAAAAVLLVGALVLPPTLSGRDDSALGAAAESSADMSALAPATEVRELDDDLQPDDLVAFATAARAAMQGDRAGVAAPVEGAMETDVVGSLAEATTCLREAFPSLTTEPVEVFAVTFDGTAAWVGVYLERIDEGEVARAIAAARDGCTVLSTAAAAIDP